ncbi:hypothetical protein ACP93_06525 [Xanthomonas sp. NCPPB 1128]|uniref:DUF6689 family protein n=1 Tax=Xanthomonas sp. NCPPB 1128 TaxID=1775876 RepID=UPI00065AF4CB|nr:DUF6689 family protein [Xanthomonas sp. NCPPB 1128]KMM76455.1 hypothetical protein ACP93_06525 [Xanthomonas sp. NCPPB 1128]
MHTMFARVCLLFCAMAASGGLAAQPLPVQVDVSGNVATAAIGAGPHPLAELTLEFDDVTDLSPGNLGLSAELLTPAQVAALLPRLPSTQASQVPSQLPLLITVTPPPSGGLTFRRVVHVELHTHALAYTADSTLRLFKAPEGGDFRDITDEIAPGSVRARGTTGGFSQFIVLHDLRPTATVVTAKLSRLQALVAQLPANEAAPLASMLNSVQSALANADYTAATVALDGFREQVSARAGHGIAQTWNAGMSTGNPAGELLAGAATLRFSIDYQRLYAP